MHGVEAHIEFQCNTTCLINKLQTAIPRSMINTFIFNLFHLMTLLDSTVASTKECSYCCTGYKDKPKDLNARKRESKDILL